MSGPPGKLMEMLVPRPPDLSDELGARGGNETTRGITTVFAQLGTVRRGCQFSS